MILQSENNTPVSAPVILSSEVLAKFKAWRGSATLTKEDLYLFIIKKSAERDEFINSLSAEYVNNISYIEQKFK